jgi:hypothetical protein
VKALRLTPAARDANELSKSASVAARLRVLAREHGEGQLSRDAYRKLRAPLIDALDGADELDPQSSTIPHFEPRVRGARAINTDPDSPGAATAAPREEARRGPFGRIFAWVAAAWRR